MPKTAWKTLVFSVQKHLHFVGLMWFLIVLGNVIAFSVPYFFKLIADYAFENQNGTFEAGGVLWPILGAVSFLLLQEIFFRSADIVELYTALGAFERVTAHLYNNLIGRPSSYFEDRFSGELGRRVEQVGESVKYFIERFPWEIGWAASALVVSTVLMSIAHPMLLLGLLIWTFVFIAISVPMLRWQFTKSKGVAGTHAAMSGRMVDTLANIMLVHSFGAERVEKENFKGSIGNVLVSERKERWVSIANKFHQGMSVATLGIMLVLVSVYLFDKGDITVGDFVLVATTLPSLTGVIWTLGDTVVNSVRNFGNLTDAIANLQTDIERLDEGDATLDVAHKEVVFNNISFKYPGARNEVFTNFTLRIESGEKVGIVGSSGAGKSTLIKLLLRQYEADSGVIKIGDQNIQSVRMHSLRESVAFVPQDTTLFHRTLFENIHYAKPSANTQQVLSASQNAHTHDFIETMPDGYETKVGERGVKLSGGQRQRIAVARAMLKDAPILVLDEATSALDSESEEVVQKGLRELFQDRTVIAIAHRLSTLREMNRIVVIENGQIVEDGAPEELLQRERGIFKELWEHQKGGFVNAVGA